MNELDTNELVEIIFSVEGLAEPRTLRVPKTTTVGQFGKTASQDAGITGPVLIYLENSDEPLGAEGILLDHLPTTFAPFHVALHRDIRVNVRYQNAEKQRVFRPSATILRIIEWAIGPEGFGLTGDASDIQIKHDGQVVPKDYHLGQLARGDKTVTLDLVFNVKPQG